MSPHRPGAPPGTAARPARLEHIALAVADLDAALEHYESVWGLGASHRELVEDQGVEEATLPLGDSGAQLQLLGPTGPDTAVGRFLASRGEGLHHIAYEVDDIEAALAALKAHGVELIDERPRPGGRGHLVAFVHPRANHGVLVELVQHRSHP